jgi:hypothetical protein
MQTIQILAGCVLFGAVLSYAAGRFIFPQEQQRHAGELGRMLLASKAMVRA